MRIGVDATPLQQLHGGISYYTFFLLDELIQIRENDTFFLFNNKITDHLEHFRKYKNVRIATYPPSFVGHSIWAQTLLSYGCWIEKIDLFWGTTQSIPLFKRSSTKTILTLHDFVYLICPETTSLFKKIYLKLLCRKMLQKADIILPVSAGTGSKLQRFYNIDYHSIISPPLKPQMTFEQTSRHNFKKYLVVIGTLEPRKNLQSLIDVYLEMLKNYPAEDILPLVIIGGRWVEE